MTYIQRQDFHANDPDIFTYLNVDFQLIIKHIL